MNRAAPIAIICLFAPASMAGIANPGFETGDLTGWSTFEANTVGEGIFRAATGGSLLPLSGATAPPASAGDTLAISDMAAAGLRVLYQDITIPENATLSFDLWWNNAAGFWVNPDNMFPNPFPNQHARIDLIALDAPLNTTSPDDIALSLVTLDEDDPTQSGGWRGQQFDLAALAGQTLRLRIAEVDNQGPLYVAVDNFALIPTPGATTLLLLAIGGTTRRRR
ncbi:MAG: hypothetical protein ABL309_09710 [Phycisphaerales bacterium]